MGGALIHADRRTDMTKLIYAAYVPHPCIKGIFTLNVMNQPMHTGKIYFNQGGARKIGPPSRHRWVASRVW